MGDRPLQSPWASQPRPLHPLAQEDNHQQKRQKGQTRFEPEVKAKIG